MENIQNRNIICTVMLSTYPSLLFFHWKLISIHLACEGENITNFIDFTTKGI